MIDIFNITNGRSTHKYSYKSLLGCNNIENITVIKNLKLDEALNYCLKKCKSKYFLKVDDDFIFHPKSFDYIKYCIENNIDDNLGIYHWKLWEDFSKKVVECVKVYSYESMKKIGGFQFDLSGKTDMATQKKLIKHNFSIIADDSIIAIHAMGSINEQKKYLNLWKKNAKNSAKYKKRRYSDMLKYNKSVKYQYELRTDFLTYLNKKKDTKFWRWMNSE